MQPAIFVGDECPKQVDNVRLGLGVDSSSSIAWRASVSRSPPSDAAPTGGKRPAALSARQALRLATRGGADVMGRNDIGRLASGMSADLIAINLDQLAYAGATHDPIAAVMFCQPQTVDWRIQKHNSLSQQLINT